MPNRLVLGWLIASIGIGVLQGGHVAHAQPTFRTGVDLVSVTAVVSDKGGRPVRELTRDDFQVFDDGERRPMLEFWADDAAALSLALLFDVSGSMHVGSKIADARSTAKGYVNQGIAEVNEKVETLSEALEETQEQTRKNAEGVAEAQGQAQAAGQSADAAGRSAAEAGSAAAAADTKAEAAGRDTERLMRLLYEVVLSAEQSNFGFGQSELPEGAKGELDRLVGRLKADSPQNVYIEIEGHTDSTGDAAVNERLGLERAEAVKRYLHESHEIPLHRMNVISYGEEKPIAPNDTRDGRAQNRRVVLRVLT